MGLHVLEVALIASLVPKLVHMEDQNLPSPTIVHTWITCTRRSDQSACHWRVALRSRSLRESAEEMLSPERGAVAGSTCSMVHVLWFWAHCSAQSGLTLRRLRLPRTDAQNRSRSHSDSKSAESAQEGSGVRISSPRAEHERARGAQATSENH